MGRWSLADGREVEVVGLFVDALHEVTGKSFSGIGHDSVIGDLGVDSLSLMQIVGILEDQVGVTLADEEIARIRTVGDIERLIAAKRTIRQ
jgi:acyl carrier protein